MNLIKSTGAFGFFTLISRVLGYVRDVLIAIFLGSGPIADAFFVAFRLPNTFRRLFSEGTFNAAFVPSYTSEKVVGKNNSKKFAGKIFNLLLFSLLILTIFAEIFMPNFVYLIAPGFSESSDKFDLTVKLTRITFPFLLFVSLSSFFSAILNSHNKFAVAAASPIILNIFLIFGLLFFDNLEDKLVVNVSYIISLSGFVQLLILIFFTRSFYFPKISLNIKIDYKIKEFFRKLLPSIFASGVTQINILVGTIIASFQASAVSYLYYADRIYQINLAIAGIAIGAVILPKLSEYIKKNNKNKIKFIQNKALELSLFLSIPATLALLISSEEITSALFGYGSFDFEGVKKSARALFYFSLGLPAYSLTKIFSSFLFARDNTKIPFYFSLISVIINIVLSVYFFNDYGFIIIPIATTISAWINTFFLLVYIKFSNYFTINESSIINILRILFTNLIVILMYSELISYFKNFLIYDSEYKLITIVLIVIFTFIIYIILSILTKAFRISDLKQSY